MELAHRIVAAYGPLTFERPCVTLSPDDARDVGEHIAEIVPYLGELRLFGVDLCLTLVMRPDEIRQRLDAASLAHLEALWTENRDKLAVAQTYPIDRAAVRKWRSLLPPDLELFGQLVATKLQHVSFAAFLDHLTAAANEAIAACRGRQILLVIEDEVEKSGLWAVLLIWPVLRAHVGAVVLQRDLYAADDRPDPGGWLVVLVDDAVYSGMQLVSRYYRRPHSAGWAFFIIAGAMSSLGRRRLLLTVPTLQFPKRALYFTSIGEMALEYVDDAAVDALNIRLARYRYLGANTTQHLIYFDHKLADSQSVSTFVIEAAPVRVGGVVVSYGSMIVGGTLAGHVSLGETAVPAPLLVDASENTVSEHPPPFYKRIDYTVGGERLTDDRLRALFR